VERRTPSAEDEICQAECVVKGAGTEARSLLADDAAYAGLARIFGALADQSRAKIVHLLLQQELCTCDIAAIVGISESGVSQHLRLLRSLRLVRSRREGKFVYYSLDDAHVALLIQIGLTHQGHEGQDEAGVAVTATAREDR
jgi:DNA-binding transcriptional ArsR family regulator